MLQELEEIGTEPKPRSTTLFDESLNDGWMDGRWKKLADCTDREPHFHYSLGTREPLSKKRSAPIWKALTRVTDAGIPISTRPGLLRVLRTFRQQLRRSAAVCQ